MADTPSIRLLLIDRSPHTTVHKHPDVQTLTERGWTVSRVEPRTTEKRGAQWLVALTRSSDFAVDDPTSATHAVSA